MENKFDNTTSLGAQSKWYIFKYLIRIGDFPAAFSILFMKRKKS